jgi:lysyl-tRNA synthetase class 2
MLDFYMAYANYADLMTLTEELFNSVAQQVNGSSTLSYQGQTIELAPPWERLTIKKGILNYSEIAPDALEKRESLQQVAESFDIDPNLSSGKLLTEIFERVAEPKLIQPTFVLDFPTDVSPLSKTKPDNPEVVERFEVYIGAKEIANGFTELNDPIDQRQRFEKQVQERNAGDEEAHQMDDDYVRALEYGMPPTAGEGIGIDRLIMLFTDSASIRDVILFPQLRKENVSKSEGTIQK